MREQDEGPGALHGGRAPGAQRLALLLHRQGERREGSKRFKERTSA